MIEQVYVAEPQEATLSWVSSSQTMAGTGSDPHWRAEINALTRAFRSGRWSATATYTISDENVRVHALLGQDQQLLAGKQTPTGGWQLPGIPFQTAGDPLRDFRESLAGWSRRDWAILGIAALSLLVLALPVVRLTPTTDVEDIPVVSSPPPTEEPESVAPPIPDPKRMLATLSDGLRLTFDEIHEITGIARTTLFYWKGGETVPRPAKLTPLLRLYALARALLGHFREPEEAAAWLRAGNPSPLQLLKRGDFDKVEDAVAALVFAESTVGYEPQQALRPDEDVDVPVGSRMADAKPARRVARRGAAAPE
jgi:hypothetical protein